MLDTFLKPASGRPKYSYDWAREVVDALLAEHARAAEALLEFYQITPKDLVAYLVRADPVWNYLKKRMKYLERQAENQLADVTTIQMLSNEEHYYRLNADESTAERLDRRIKVLQDERAGFKKAEAARSGAEGGFHPLSFFQLFLFPEEMGVSRELVEVRSVPARKSRAPQKCKSLE